MSAKDSDRIARWTLYTSGAILTLAGVLMIADSIFGFVSEMVLLGISLLLSGANNLVPHFSMKDNPLRPAWLLPAGAADALFGVLSLSHLFDPPAILAVWALIAGCVRLYMFCAVGRSGVAKRWAALGSAALMIAISALLLSRLPIAGVFSGVFLAAIGAAVANEGRMLYGRVS
ncbi:MAG: DUF308 domain-containing protein [Synergistaceae bacterium]|jgi:uncharacterized membrane protein HdeD (DUF308 family)|nr:DUF308 domain-containing protein [Synergistaceae bacterium]